nr:immunoglobulin light chain junction region [Macaca mulatta]MOV73961.1 immunoglobulin light chain junction region [Macaca mulatta]MOX46034.1 immunoglobulin light chain junction region [Macaca mulatta]
DYYCYSTDSSGHHRVF